MESVGDLGAVAGRWRTAAWPHQASVAHRLHLMATQIVAEIIKQILVLKGREDLAGVAAYEAPLRVE